jgi:hypothetical protein
LDRLAPKHIYEQVDQEPEPEPEPQYEEVHWLHTFLVTSTWITNSEQVTSNQAKLYEWSEAFN